jgi:hypothetical protein
MYKKVLQVATPEGEKIVAHVQKSGTWVIINVPYLEAVKKDKPEFAKKGIINFKVKLSDYSNAIISLTKYLEDLFLKEMSDENNRTSIRTKSKSGRNERKDTETKTGTTEGEGDSASLHDSTRGNQQTQSDRGRTADSKMDKIDDQEISRQD